ncbi:MAG: hypothetical protein JHC33_14935 [Ignisphaera sp.]|nr:hypothetical protein [Ignisphaera sp.]
MKSPYAQAESLCLKDNQCCVTLNDISRILDAVSLIEHEIKSIVGIGAKEERDTYINDLSLAKNALINIRGSLETVIQVVAGRSSDDEAFIHTMSNILNRLVEVRNRIMRVSEGEAVSEDVKKNARRVILLIDAMLFSLSIIFLSLSTRIRKWSKELAGAFSSSIASALFASLLTMHENSNVMKYIGECLA